MDFNLHSKRNYVKQTKTNKHIQRGGGYSKDEIEYAQELLGESFRLFMREVYNNDLNMFKDDNDVVQDYFIKYVMTFTHAFKVLGNLKKIPNNVYQEVLNILQTRNDLIVEVVKEQMLYNTDWALKKGLKSTLTTIGNTPEFDKLQKLLSSNFKWVSYEQLKSCIEYLAYVFENDQTKVNDAVLTGKLADIICGLVYDTHEYLTVTDLIPSFTEELKKNSDFYDIFFEMITRSNKYEDVKHMKISDYFKFDDGSYPVDYYLIPKKDFDIYYLPIPNDDRLYFTLTNQTGGNDDIIFLKLLKKYLGDKNYAYSIFGYLNINLKSTNLEGILNMSNAILEYDTDNKSGEIEAVLPKNTEAVSVISYAAFVQNIYKDITNFKTMRYLLSKWKLTDEIKKNTALVSELNKYRISDAGQAKQKIDDLESEIVRYKNQVKQLEEINKRAEEAEEKTRQLESKINAHTHKDDAL